jgi:hypothetical protein
MSTYASDYSMSSINSINENIYNTQKQQKSSKYRLRKIFKPILKMLLQKKNKKTACTCKNTSTDSYDYSSEIFDNASNETLETRIMDEIRDCKENSAVIMYGENEDYLMKVDREQTFVPVHFARTDAGTFFWTSFSNQGFCHQEENLQLPQLHIHKYDRWIQA